MSGEATAFDNLLATERRDPMLCDCGAPATTRLVVQLREVGPTGSFVKGGKSIQRAINCCDEHGVERWTKAREAAFGGQS